MELFGISGDLLWEFAVFGWIINIATVIILFVIMVIKGLFLSPSELMEFRMFAKTREFYISTYTPSYRVLISNIMSFVPTYPAWIALVNMYYVLTISGSSGLIKGTMMADQWHIVQLIKYQYVEKK